MTENLPYVCPMCSLKARILYQCDVCCDEGCQMCLPSGDRSTCLNCAAQAEVVNPPEIEPRGTSLVPDQSDEELDRMYEQWSGGQQAPDETEETEETEQ